MPESITVLDVRRIGGKKVFRDQKLIFATTLSAVGVGGFHLGTAVCGRVSDREAAPWIQIHGDASGS